MITCHLVLPDQKLQARQSTQATCSKLDQCGDRRTPRLSRQSVITSTLLTWQASRFDCCPPRLTTLLQLSCQWLPHSKVWVGQAEHQLDHRTLDLQVPRARSAHSASTDSSRKISAQNRPPAHSSLPQKHCPGCYRSQCAGHQRSSMTATQSSVQGAQEASYSTTHCHVGCSLHPLQ
jgi:hypothetical protein